MARKKNKIELKKQIENFIDRVTDNFNVDEVVLFGSYAKDLAHDWSDIDLAVISPDLKNKSIYRNNKLIEETLKLYDPDLQLVSFPSTSYYNETFIDPEFIKEIKRTGKTVYTKESGANFSTL